MRGPLLAGRESAHPSACHGNVPGSGQGAAGAPEPLTVSHGPGSYFIFPCQASLAFEPPRLSELGPLLCGVESTCTSVLSRRLTIPDAVLGRESPSNTSLSRSISTYEGPWSKLNTGSLQRTCKCCKTVVDGVLGFKLIGEGP
jgi:hypothetical protein